MLSACGSASGNVITRQMAVCASDGALVAEAAVEVPASFAPNFPAPPGMVWYKAAALNADSSHPQMQLVGVAPLGLKESAQFLVKQLPKAGYTLGYGESEANEIEAQFKGNGWSGGFILHRSEQCAQLTTWTINIVKL